LGEFDTRWGSEGDQEIQAALRRYLKAHESEFVQWVP
jgi:ABC-type proline/glycine betaine transport system substrate-binding protein